MRRGTAIHRTARLRTSLAEGREDRLFTNVYNRYDTQQACRAESEHDINIGGAELAGLRSKPISSTNITYFSTP